MTGSTIVARFLSINNWLQRKNPTKQLDLHTLWLDPRRVPHFVATMPVARRILELLGPLHFSSRMSVASMSVPCFTHGPPQKLAQSTTRTGAREGVP